MSLPVNVPAGHSAAAIALHDGQRVGKSQVQ